MSAIKLHPTANGPTVPLLARGVIGAADDAMMRTVASNLEDAVKTAVRRAAYPAFSAELRDRLVAKHVSEVTAAIPPPVDPDTSFIDRLAVASLEPRARAVVDKTRHVDEAADKVRARRDRVAEIPIPMKALTRVVWSVVVVLVAVAVAIAVGVKLGISIDAFILRPIVEDAYGEGSQRLSLALSMRLGILIAVALLVSQAVITVIAARFVDTWVKLGFIIVDVVFSVAFFYLRTGSGASGQGIAFSLLEASLSLGLAIVLLAAAARLKANDENRELRSVAEQELLVAQEDLVALTAERDAEATQLQAQLLALEKREVANRMQTKHEELAATAAHAAYVVEAAALINEAATLQTDHTINDMVRAYLTTEERRLGLSGGHSSEEVNRAA
jgi:hypothetical protein